MTRTLARALLAASAALAVAGCHDPQRCRPGTLFLDLTLAEGAAAAADGLRVDVQTSAGTLHDRVAYAHQTAVGLEVDFPGGYPSGQTVVVTVTAQAGASDLASGSASLLLDGSCARAAVVLSGPACNRVSGDFSQPPDASWALVGDAKPDPTQARVILTDNATDQDGALFYATPLTLGSLDARFSLYMGSGSDGVALLLTPQAPLTLPASTHGPGIGYQGLPGWAVEFDTYNNGDHGDVDGNHVAFMRAIDGLHLLAAPSTLQLACDCTRQAHVQLTASHVHVDLDGLALLDGDLPALPDDGGAPLTTGSWILGFTSAAGGAAAAHAVGNVTLAAGGCP